MSNKASREGRKIIRDLKKLDDKADMGHQIGTGAAGDALGMEGATFPARYYQPQDRDDHLMIKDVLTRGRPERPAPITDEDVEYVRRKRDALESEKMETWFAKTWKADSSNPTMQRWAQGIYPEFFSKREETINAAAELQKRAALLKLYGPRSKEDIEMLYAIQSGYLQLPDQPIHKLTGQGREDRFNRGMFNPRNTIILNHQAQSVGLGNPVINGFQVGGNAVGPAADTFSTQGNHTGLFGYNQL